MSASRWCHWRPKVRNWDKEAGMGSRSKGSTLSTTEFSDIGVSILLIKKEEKNISSIIEFLDICSFALKLADL